MTFSRLSYIDGDPGRIDDLIVYVKTVVKPATDQLAGNRGLGMWVNRETGSGLVATVWNDESSLFGSEVAVIKLRDDGAGIVGGDARVERYEIAFTDMASPNQCGFITRILRLACEPSKLSDNVMWARENVTPALRNIEGYSSYVIAADRTTGTALSITTYCDPTAAAAGYEATRFARETLPTRGTMLLASMTYEVAMVGIRDTPVMPGQRQVDLTEARGTVTSPG